MRNVSEHTRPVTDFARRGKVVGAWNNHCYLSFERLKKALVHAPVLIAPNWEKYFVLYFEASENWIGGILTENDENGCTRMMPYFFKWFSSGERNFTANDRKLLASVNLLQRFRCFMEESSFLVITDSQAVYCISRKPNLSRREAHWL